MDQSNLRPPSTRPRIPKCILFLAAGVTALGLLLVIALLLSRVTPHYDSNTLESFRHEITLLVFFAALTFAALVAGIALAIVSHRLQGKPVSLTNTVERSESGTPIKPHRHERRPAFSSAARYEGKHLLKLNRDTERLVSVEQDLIRRISENYDIDRRTYRLMTEIQICTNRILGQLQDMESVGCVAAEEPSDVELDDITVG